MVAAMFGARASPVASRWQTGGPDVLHRMAIVNHKGPFRLAVLVGTGPAAGKTILAMADERFAKCIDGVWDLDEVHQDDQGFAYKIVCLLTVDPAERALPAEDTDDDCLADVDAQIGALRAQLEHLEQQVAAE
jgi:hypothetical protein